MVLAGPGSGKTFTIVQRVAYLIRECHVKPDQILVMTFTRKAALQMRERIRGTGAGRVRFGTFHSVYYQILLEEGRLNRESILSEEEKIRMLSTLLTPGETERFDSKEELLEFCARAVNEIGREQTAGEAGSATFIPDMNPELYHSLKARYTAEKKRCKRVDYSDILTDCRDLLSGDQEALSRWQKRFCHILVDEFQDINPIQFDVLRMLAGPEDNLFVVGDDDQAIYGFRGSSPDIMIRFPSYYPGYRKICLDRNYRSTAQIVRAGLRLIGHASKRLDKHIIIPDRQGSDPEIIFFEDEKLQYSMIRHLIRDLPENETAAVLVRTNGNMRSVTRALQDYGGDIGMMEDVLAFSRTALSFGNQDQGVSRADFLRMTRYYDLTVSRDLLRETVRPDDLLSAYGTQPWICRGIESFFREAELVSGLPPYAGMQIIRNRMSSLNSIGSSIILRAKDAHTWDEWIGICQSLIGEMSDAHAGTSGDAFRQVRIMTMHAAKGLEFDTVIIPDLNEGICPHSRSLKKPEEERRLLYVAMTRARKRLVLTCPERRRGSMRERSRFLREMAEKGVCPTVAKIC